MAGELGLGADLRIERMVHQLLSGGRPGDGRSTERHATPMFCEVAKLDLRKIFLQPSSAAPPHIQPVSAGIFLP